MKTSELVKAVAMETGLTVSATEKAVNAVFSAIKKEVCLLYTSDAADEG